jgi:hypothetical protein
MYPASRIILSLCDYTGAWSAPYRAGGYDVRQIDLKGGFDVRLMPFPGRVWGILAAPPCDRFCNPSARLWSASDTPIQVSAPEVCGHIGRWETSQTLNSLSIADACLRLVALCSPSWWALENSVGRLPGWYGDPKMMFHPYQYADLADDPISEAYTKKTCLWGNFTTPDNRLVCPEKLPAHLPPGRRDRTSRMSSTDKSDRAKTPQGFARAFFQANP